MTIDLDQLRSFRIDDAQVDLPSRDAARATLLAHIASQAESTQLERRAAGQRSLWLGLRRWLGGSVHAAAAIASLGLVVVVVALAFGLHQRGGSGATGKGSSASRQQLLGLLGVLREPQTGPARGFDRTGWPIVGTPHQRGDLAPDRPLIRLAAVTPWGAEVFVVPLRPPTSRQLACVDGGLGETVALYVQGIGWSDFATPADIARGGAGGPEGRVPGTAGKLEAGFEIVPDGVAKVVYYLAPVLPLPGHALKIVGSVTATVKHNVAILRARRLNGALLGLWYAADGSVIKRIGDWDQFRRVDGQLIMKAPGRPSAAERGRALRQSRSLLSRRERAVSQCRLAHGFNQGAEPTGG